MCSSSTAQKVCPTGSVSGSSNPEQFGTIGNVCSHQRIHYFELGAIKKNARLIIKLKLEKSAMEAWKYLGENDNIIFSSIIGIVGSVAGIVILIAIIRLIRTIRDRKLLKTATSLNRGTKSERHLVLQLLKHGIPAPTIFHDLCIEKKNGEFSQIDIVVATTEGIIVIEVKDYSGWIFGNGNYTHWTKVLAYGKKKYRFYNPIKQNKSHIETLRKKLRQFENIPFFSIIVFYGDCELKEINYVPKRTFLVKSPRILEVLRLIKTNNEAAPYTNKREVLGILKQGVLKGENLSNHKKHIENINDMLGKDRIFD